MKFRDTFVIASLLGLSALAHGQNAQIQGRVADATGAVITRATVRIVDQKTNSERHARTNSAGQYVAAGLTPSQYKIFVEAAGFNGAVSSILTLNVGQNAVMDFELRPGGGSETVTVQASDAAINTTDSTVSTVIDRQFVQEMPLNGRSFQNLLLLAPGTTYASPQGSGSLGEISVNGQRTDGNNVSVDGASGSNQPFQVSGPGSAGMTQTTTAIGTTQATLSVDAMQEFRIATSTYSAEFGRQPGAQVVIKSRSGSNDYHGTAFDYLRNVVFDANDWFNNYANPKVARPQEKQNDFGGTLGGPISVPYLFSGRNRAFFFASYEGLRLTTPQISRIYYVPSNGTNNTAKYADARYKDLRANTTGVLQQLLSAWPEPNCTTARQPQCVDKGDGFSPYLRPSLPAQSSLNSTSVRLDYQMFSWLRVFARYADTPSSVDAPATVGPYRQPTQNRTRFYLLGFDSVIRSNMTSELRLQYSPSFYRTLSYYDPEITAHPFDLWQMHGMPSAGYFVTSFRMPSSGTSAIYQVSFGTRQFQPNATETFTWLHGRHLIKAGADYRQTTAYYGDGELSKGPQAYYTWTSAAQMLGSNPSPASAQAQVYARQDPTNKNLGIFVQDEWRVHPRLTISSGLRWDFAPPPSVSGAKSYTYTGDIKNPSTLGISNPGAPLYKTTYTGFAPRLGLALTLHNQPGRELVVRAGAGMFYGLLGSYGAYGNGTTVGAGVNNVYTPTTSYKSVFPLPVDKILVPITAPTAPYTFSLYPSNDLKPPSSIQWSVGLEQALGQKQSFTMTYVASKGLNPVIYKQYSLGTITHGLINTINQYENGDGGSRYDSLQLQYKRAVLHGLQALASYTWSHAIDTSSTELYTYYLPIQKGNSNQDVRHNFNTALVYNVPGKYENRINRAVLAHWSASLRFVARTGYPVSPTGLSTVDPSSGFQQTGRLNYNGRNPYVSKKGIPGGRQFDPTVFSIPVAGTIGTAPRNFLRGFGLHQEDLAVSRTFPVYETLKLLFRAEAFNILNHPAYGSINVACGASAAGATCNNTLFGQATTTLANVNPGNGATSMASQYRQGGPRSLQFALKLEF